MRKKQIIILICLICSILLVVGMSLFLTPESNEQERLTGGQGQPPKGYLSLTGYGTPVTNSRVGSSVGRYLTIKQQSTIRSYLEALLYNQEPRDEYRGEIVAGSSTIDYDAPSLTFKVKINEPAVVYTIKYDTSGLDMQVFNEQGKELKPPTE